MNSFYFPHSRVLLNCGDHLVTKQSHKAECDINTILSQFSRTGVLNHLNSISPQFLDLPSSLDYQSSLNVVLEAEEAFASLPSAVRHRFSNDPSRLLSALADPAMADELRRLGVLNPLPAQPVPAQPVPSPAKPAGSVGVGGAVPPV